MQWALPRVRRVDGWERGTTPTETDRVQALKTSVRTVETFARHGGGVVGAPGRAGLADRQRLVSSS